MAVNRLVATSAAALCGFAAMPAASPTMGNLTSNPNTAVAVMETPKAEQYEFRWISPTRLLIAVNNKRESRTLLNDSVWQLSILDIVTKKLTALPKLSHLLTRTHAETGGFGDDTPAISPDGKRLLWVSFRQNPAYHYRPGKLMAVGDETYPESFHACMARLDGGGFVEYGLGAVRSTDALIPPPVSWSSDSRTWNECLRWSVPEGKQRQPQRRCYWSAENLHTVFTRSAVSHSHFGTAVAFPHLPLDRMRELSIFQNGKGLIGSDSQEEPTRAVILLSPGGFTAYRVSGPFPDGKDLYELAFSAAGDRVAWTDAQSGKSAQQIWESRLGRYSGRDKPIAHLVATLPAKGLVIAYPQWSPDDRNLAYECAGKIWIQPVAKSE